MANYEGSDKKTNITGTSNGISSKVRNNKKRSKGSKAYYTVMSLILTACIVTGAYSWISYNSREDTNKFAQFTTTPDVSYADEVGNSLNLALDEATPMAEETVDVDASGEKKSKNDKESENTEETSVEVSYPEFIAPVNGSICLEYSMEAPVFSETLQEWRTHSGIDIAANMGDEVRCAADGVVQYVKNDPRYGTTVIVDHKSGVNTVYSNLAENVEVTSGQQVATGDVLGYVGTTAYFESLDTAHLHLEVTANNENVDPTNMFPLEK